MVLIGQWDANNILRFYPLSEVFLTRGVQGATANAKRSAQENNRARRFSLIKINQIRFDSIFQMRSV